ncbi:MAG: cation:proton antiporter [Proteobacteria bacterium]|nr:cation:proton antiporter [Pseudomonadota bacterium]
MTERLSEIFSLPLSGNIPLFTLMLAVILIMTMFTKRLHLPQVIGLILCGVAIGPHALNIIDNTGAVSLFSTIGLLYIMFTAGLELDINTFRINRNRSILFGFLTYLGPLAVIFPICFWGYRLGLLESFLVGSMFGTHTLIAYPAVSRLGVSRDPCVAVTVGGTILVDAGVLILLAVILGLASGNLSASFWIELTVSLAAFSVLMFWVIPKIGEWFFAHWHKERHLRFIFIMFMVFLSALLAEIAGLEGIVGAFVAGLVLNRLIPQSSSLMHQIEFVGNAVFIPFFLVTVGMLVDIGVILDGPRTILLALILSASALAGKYLSAFAAQKLFRYSRAQRHVMFGLSAARVAATLAIVIVAHRAGLIDETFLNAAILLILITCIVASFVTESAAQKLAIEHETQDADSQICASAQHEHLLMPIANPGHAQALLGFADLFKSPQSRNPITLLTVVPDNDQSEERIRAFQKAIDPTLKAHPELKVKVASAIDPSISEGIARGIREQLATILLMGWPKSGLTDKIIGEKWRAFVHDIEKMIVIADIPAPLTSQKRIVLFTLNNAELLPSFDIWFDKIVHLAEQSSLKIRHYGTAKTEDAMRSRIAATKKSVILESSHEDPFKIQADESLFSVSDWLIFVTSRPGTMCHVPMCEKLPLLWSKNYTQINRMLLFPANPWNADDEFEQV